MNTAGSPQDFKPNPNAGLPVVMGRYGVGGNLVYETTSGGGNKAEAGAQGQRVPDQSFVILSALGPVQAFETLRFNDTILTFDPNGQACNGGYIPYDEVQEWNPWIHATRTPTAVVHQQQLPGPRLAEPPARRAERRLLRAARARWHV